MIVYLRDAELSQKLPFAHSKALRGAGESCLRKVSASSWLAKPSRNDPYLARFFYMSPGVVSSNNLAAVQISVEAKDQSIARAVCSDYL